VACDHAAILPWLALVFQSLPWPVLLIQIRTDPDCMWRIDGDQGCGVKMTMEISLI